MSEEIIIYEEATIGQLFVGAIGEDGFFNNDRLIEVSPAINEILPTFFLKSFRQKDFFSFTHELDVEYNGAFASCRKLFEEPEAFLQESQNLLKLLYSVSENDNIKEGELYIAYFPLLNVGGEETDAVGIFKSEDRDPFIKVFQEGQSLGLMQDEGISIHNINKGALILNSEEVKNYKVLVFDKTNKQSPARFWIDHFLNLKPLEDEFFQTKNFMRMCKDFALGQNEMDRSEQVDMINRSVEYFQEHEHFNQEEFQREVLPEADQRQAFMDFQNQFVEKHEMEEMPEDFEISQPAFKATKRYIRSVIKLDKNFHVYVHGKKEMIERGYDEEKGKHYYKLYFDEEL